MIHNFLFSSVGIEVATLSTATKEETQQIVSPEQYSKKY